MSTHQSGAAGIVVVAAAFRNVSPETRSHEYSFINELSRVLARMDFDVREFWRDGTADPRQPIEELLAEDACDLCKAHLLAVIYGLPSVGLPLLLEVARILGIPVLVLQWPGTQADNIGANVVARIELTTPNELSLQLPTVIGRIQGLLGRPKQKAIELAIDHTTRRDRRPSRLKKLREKHEPPLSRSQLSRRSSVPEMRIALAEIFPWPLIDLEAREAALLANALDVPTQTLTAMHDVDAGDWLRRFQVYHHASIHETPESEIKRVVQMLSTRTYKDALAAFSTRQLGRMFRKAAEDHRRSEEV